MTTQTYERTTQTYEAPPQEHTHKTYAQKREERSELKSFPAAELGPKPLVAFDAPPASTAPPLTW
jgi:hypothetical protein